MQRSSCVHRQGQRETIQCLTQGRVSVMMRRFERTAVCLCLCVCLHAQVLKQKALRGPEKQQYVQQFQASEISDLPPRLRALFEDNKVCGCFVVQEVCVVDPVCSSSQCIEPPLHAPDCQLVLTDTCM